MFYPSITSLPPQHDYHPSRHPSIITYHYDPLMSGCVSGVSILLNLAGSTTIPPATQHHHLLLCSIPPSSRPHPAASLTTIFYPYFTPSLPQHPYLPLCPSNVWLCDSEIGASIPHNLADSTATPSPTPAPSLTTISL